MLTSVSMQQRQERLKNMHKKIAKFVKVAMEKYLTFTQINQYLLNQMALCLVK